MSTSSEVKKQGMGKQTKKRASLFPRPPMQLQFRIFGVVCRVCLDHRKKGERFHNLFILEKGG